ncbi:MAG: hypothetical protein C0621_02325 [Desulfuromonas sp.]|nr:MAG: hypothetical protein C0621_02325 [Desulfuromonas sp.]
MSSEKKRALINLLVMGLAAPIGAGFNFLMTLIAARYLMSEGFGIYSGIISIIALFQVIIEGSRNVIIRNIAREPEAMAEIFGVAKGLLWLLSLVAFIGILVTMSLKQELRQLPFLTYLIAGLAAMSIYHALGYGIVFIAKERIEFNAFGSVLHKIIGCALVYSVTCVDGNLNGVLGAITAANFGLWGFYSWIFRHRFGHVAIIMKGKELLAMFKEILVVGSTAILRRFSWNVDILLLTAFSTVAATGIFNGAYNIVYSLNMVPTFAALPFFPMLSRKAEKDGDRLKRDILRILGLFFVLALPVILFSQNYADALVLLLLGDGYSASIPVMRILLWDLLFSFPISFLFYTFLALNLQKLYLWAVTLSLLLNVLVDLLLIPSLGPLGAAYGTLAADILCLAVLLVGQRRKGPALRAA